LKPAAIGCLTRVSANSGQVQSAVPALIDRNCSAAATNRLRVADINWTAIRAGLLYLAVALDAFDGLV
jgi:hypothetical protein